MEIQKREHINSYKPQLREAGEDGDGRTIEGYAIVFGQISGLLSSDYTEHKIFREVIEPGAITMDLLNRSDIIMNLGHENYKLLARSNNGEGSLSFWLDEVGVGFRFTAPNTAEGDFAIEHVRLGNISGCSFAFYDGMENEDISWTRGDDGYYVRHVRSISAITDFSLVIHPAYPQTFVEQREDDDQERKAAEEAEMEKERARLCKAASRDRELAAMRFELSTL